MFVRVYWAHIVPGSLPEIEARYRQFVADVPGRLLRWVTQDVNDPDSILTITVWDSAESVRSWESSAGYREGVEAVRPFLVGAQTISLCEVKVEDSQGLAKLVQALGARQV